MDDTTWTPPGGTPDPSGGPGRDVVPGATDTTGPGPAPGAGGSSAVHPPPPAPGTAASWSGHAPMASDGNPYAAPARHHTPGTNGFAVASLVLGIVGGIILSVVFGIVALGQTRRRNQAGRGFAVAGLVLSGLWLVGAGVAVVLGLLAGASRGADGTIEESGFVSSTSLHVGDCVNGIRDGEVRGFPAVPCAEPHEGEVYAVFDLPEGDYPGDDAVDERAWRSCSDRMSDELYYSDSELYYLVPQRLQWLQGDHEVVCISVDAEADDTVTDA